MKVSLQFFKDMGVCDGAYAFLEAHFQKNGIEYADYLEGYKLMQTLPEFYAAVKEGGPDHDTLEGWLEWAYNLRHRAEAITYFGDHHLGDEFRTPDGLIHDTFEDAQRCTTCHPPLTVTGVKVSPKGAETWTITAEAGDYDFYVFHDPETGINHRTEDFSEAAAATETHNQNRPVPQIDQRVWSSCRQFSAWQPVDSPNLKINH